MSIRFEDNVTPLNEDNLNAVVDFIEQAHDGVSNLRRDTNTDLANLRREKETDLREMQLAFNEFILNFGSAITIEEARNMAGNSLTVAQVAAIATGNPAFSVVAFVVRGRYLLERLLS